MIENHFRDNKVSSLIYIFMAQANNPSVPPFCLLFFGTDNRMLFTDVENRQNFIVDELKKVGIKVLGYSGDGDSRVLKAMRLTAGLGTTSYNNDEDSRSYAEISGFQAKILPEIVCVQDHVHLENKWRTRLAKPNLLIMGNYVASTNDLVTLVQSCTKEKHRLCANDLTLKDKMNFATTMKICHPRIWSLLEKHVPGSEGTQIYLKIMFFSSQAFLSTNLSALQRLHCMFYCVYFLRLWRAWLKSKREFYSEVKNFITVNSYTCLELNAHGLLNLILKCMIQKDFSNFYPWIYSSQACEGYFRLLRSIASTFSMIVNCTILEFSHKIKRLEMLATVVSTEFEDFPLKFPASRFLNGSYEKQTEKFDILKQFDVTDNDITTQSIINVLEDARKMAEDDCKKLGMSIDISAASEIQLKFKETTFENRSFNDVEDDEDDEEIEEDEENNEDSLVEGDPEEMNLFEENREENLEVDESAGDVTNGQIPVSIPVPSLEELEIFSAYEDESEFPECLDTDETSISPEDRYVLIRDTNKKVKKVRKSSLCWFFNNHHKLSSDRLRRVQQSDNSQRSINVDVQTHVIMPKKESTIRITEYCVFEIPEKNFHLIGLIKYFKIITEKSDKKRMYYKHDVEVCDENEEKIGVFAMWFTINRENRTLNVFPMEQHSYIPLKYYRMTIPPPIIVNNKRNVLEELTFEEIGYIVKSTE